MLPPRGMVLVLPAGGGREQEGAMGTGRLLRFQMVVVCFIAGRSIKGYGWGAVGGTYLRAHMSRPLFTATIHPYLVPSPQPAADGPGGGGGAGEGGEEEGDRGEQPYADHFEWLRLRLSLPGGEVGGGGGAAAALLLIGCRCLRKGGGEMDEWSSSLSTIGRRRVHSQCLRASLLRHLPSQHRTIIVLSAIAGGRGRPL